MSQNAADSPPLVGSEHLIQNVSVPAFFEKVAAAGKAPTDDASAEATLALGDRMADGINLYLQKSAGSHAAQRSQAIKVATEAIRITPKGAVAPSTLTSIAALMAMPGVKEAAAQLLVTAVPTSVV